MVKGWREIKNKLRSLSFLQNFGIFLVVLGHSLPSEGITNGVEWIRGLIYSFHMPLFMAISGFLFIYSRGTKGDYVEFIKNKSVRLLIPYLAISTITFFPKVFLSRYAYRPVELSLGSFIENIIYPHENVIIFFWFLPTLFIIFLVSPIIEKGIQKVAYQILFSIFFVTLNVFNVFSNVEIFNIQGVMEYLIYFWIGCLIASYWKYLKPMFGKKIYFAVLFIILITLNFIEIENSTLELVVATIGILMSFSLSVNLEDVKYDIFKGIDGYSFQIYLLSWFPQTAVIIVFLNKLPYVAVSLSMLIAGLVLPVIVAKIVKNYLPIFSILLGMKVSKKPT